MRVWTLILILPAVILAQLDVAFMLADHEDGWTEAISFLESDLRFETVDYYDCNFFTPPVVLMQQYNVLYTGGHLSYQDQDAFGDNLADYVDGGGYVVNIFYSLYYWPYYYGIGGRWLEDEYSPYGPLGGEWFFHDYQDLNIIEPEHDIFQGVSYLNNVRGHIQLELRSGANEIADFPGYPGVAINADQTVVGLDYICYNSRQWTGDGYLIMANAACFLAGYSDVRESSWGQIKAGFEQPRGK